MDKDWYVGVLKGYLSRKLVSDSDLLDVMYLYDFGYISLVGSYEAEITEAGRSLISEYEKQSTC